MAAETVTWESDAAIQLGQMSIKIGSFTSSATEDATFYVDMADPMLCIALDQTSAGAKITSVSSNQITVASTTSGRSYGVIVFGQ